MRAIVHHAQTNSGRPHTWWPSFRRALTSQSLATRGEHSSTLLFAVERPRFCPRQGFSGPSSGNGLLLTVGRVARILTKTYFSAACTDHTLGRAALLSSYVHLL